LCLFLALAFVSSGCTAYDKSAKEQQTTDTINEADRYYSLGKNAEGLTWIDRAIALMPDDLSTYIGQPGSPGVVGVMQKYCQYGDLIPRLSKALKYRDIRSSVTVYEALIDAQQRVASPTQAEATARQMLALVEQLMTKPTGADSDYYQFPLLGYKAEAEWFAGDHASATIDFRKAIATTSGDKRDSLENDLAYNEAVAGADLPEALQLAKAAVKDAGNNATDSDGQEIVAEFTDTLGWAEYKSGDYKDAVCDLEQAMAGLPQMADTHFHLAEAYRASGRYREARIEYNRAVMLDSTNKQAAAQLKLLPLATS